MISNTLIRALIIVLPILSGSVISWTAQAVAAGRIKRNWAIGIRFPQTMKSEDAWLACHVRARRALTGGGFAMIIVGAAGFLPLPLPVSLTILAAGALTMLACVIVAAVVGVRAANRVG